MKNLYLSCALILVTIISYGQDVLTTGYGWSVSGIRDLATNSMGNTYTCTFKTKGSSDIIWEQKSGYIVNLKVTSIQGIWTDVTRVGKVLFNVSSGGETGTILFEKTSTGTYITLNLSQKSGNQLRYKYTVTQVNALTL